MEEAKGQIEEPLGGVGNDEYYVEDKGCQTESQEGEVEVAISEGIQQITGTLNNLKTADQGGVNVQAGKDHPAEQNDVAMQMETDEIKPNIVIIAPFFMPPTILDTKEAGITWIGLPRITIDSVTNRILAELKESDPNKAKWITVSAYQQFIVSHNSATIERHLVKIMEAARESKIHKISLATFFHVPEEEKSWEKISMMNQHLRLLNLDMGMPPNNVHKSLLFSFTDGRVCYIRYNIWVERMNNTGIGSTLNFEGLTRYKNYLLKFIHEGGFKDHQGPLVRALGGDGSPAPLCFTRGYKNNQAMLEFMRIKGLRLPAKPVGDNRTDQEKKIEKARAVARKLAEESKAKYGQDFDDEKGEPSKQKKGGRENRMKTGKERLDERDKKRKEDKEHQLTLEINKLKLETMKARSRSKSKYEEFEKEIDRLKDKLRQKDRLLSELRRDLARAEVDCEEWKEIADRARGHSSAKRARRY